MSDHPQIPEDIVADALANGLNACGVEALVILSLKDGKITRRIYGDPLKAKSVAVRYAATVMRDTVESITEAEEVAE